MEIRCEKCEARFRIPDEKIPLDRLVTVNCPKCGNGLVLRRPDPVKEAANGTTVQNDHIYGDEDSTLDLYEEDTELALVMADESAQEERLKHAVDSLGYKPIIVKNSREAIGKMRLHQFALIVISDPFDGSDIEKGPIINYLNRLPMSIRRRILVAAIGDRFKTMDHMMAFALSVNLVINNKEIDKSEAILKHALTDNEKFYKIFLEVLSEVGKA